MQRETERLLLRPPSPSDAPALFAFMGDAQVMRYTQPRTSLEDCRDYLAAHEKQRERIGCAPWVVIGKAERAIVGFGGLYEDPFDPDWGIEIGYFFTPSAWGRGYATELTRFCLEIARENPAWTQVRAFAHPDNIGSRRVIMKAGFEEERFVPEMERCLYRFRLREA